MIIACAGQKGGVAKSTTAISLAAEWHSRGRRVLLVDADPQGTSRTWAAIGAERGHSLPTVVAMGLGFHRPDQLPALSRNYDITIIDCPPRLGEIQKSALMVADLVLLPCGPAAPDAWALADSADLVKEAQIYRPELLAVVLITKKNGRTAIGAGAREALQQAGFPVLASELAHRVTYQEAPAAGLGPSVYEPNGPAAKEVRSLATELEGFMHQEVVHVAV